MAMRRSIALWATVASTASLSACTLPDYSDTRCTGYLGCSDRQSIGPAMVEETVAKAPDPAAGLPATGINAVAPSSGCGKDVPADQVGTVPGTPKGYTHYTVMGTGQTLANTIAEKAGPRTFWVRVPADYDPNHAYRVVYIGQGCGGYENANLSTLPLYKESLGGTEQAIYVALDIPRDMVNMDCYDNRDGVASQEWEAFQLFHDVVESTYCVDNNRIYATGYSTGGWLANMWGCYFAGDGMNPAGSPGVPRKFAPKYHVRAQAAVTGGEPANQPKCNGPVAALWIHDAGDKSNVISGNVSALARVGEMNGCDTKYDGTTNQTPWHPEFPMLGDVCRQFTGCPENYPVVFCTTNGYGHADQAERATTAFKAFFDMLEPMN
jgi:poly(3-hydroxybutyrate) depolymerase